MEITIAEHGHASAAPAELRALNDEQERQNSNLSGADNCPDIWKLTRQPRKIARSG